MQESRLFQIVYYLLDRGWATASELAEKFEVSVRTIYRDIDALSGAGIPVYAEAGRSFRQSFSSIQPTGLRQTFPDGEIKSQTIKNLNC